jgi:AraC-like DNA-binding protein
MPDVSYTFYETEEPSSKLSRRLPVEISSTGHETRWSRSYRWNNERHSFSRSNILQYTLTGWGYYEFIRGEHRVRERVGPGRMFIAAWDRDFEYFFDGNTPWDFLWISLAGSFADQAVQALREPLPVIELAMDSAPILILKNLQDRLAGSYRIDHYALTSLGYEFLVQLLKERDKSGASPENRFLADARSYVTRNIGAASVSSLARHFGYGEKYFNEYFKRRAGATPNRFIIEQRMRYASSLLVNTRKKIAVIAEELGFADDNYFSKVFKKHCGMPPAEYRERNKDIIPVNEIVIL